MSKPSPMGNTFAERAAAAAGAASFKDPTPDAADSQENTTFADRAKAAKKTSAKQVKADDVEDKAVAKKTVAKKS